MFVGQYPLGLDAVYNALSDSSSVDYLVIVELRLPRLLGGILVGASLAITGACMQGIFRNPLVEPSLIGVSAGSALFVVLFLVLGNQFLPVSVTSSQWTSYCVPVFAFAGALVAVKIVMSLGTLNGRVSTGALLLSGIAVNAFCGAFMGLTLYFANDAQLRSITFWNMGSLANIGWSELLILTVICCWCVHRIYKLSYQLDIMCAGEDQASSLGVNIDSLIKRIIGLTCFIVGTCVAFTGIIGFVGLLVPHITRMLIGANYKQLIPACALTGALALILSDTLARVAIKGAELPLGAITAFLGAPFFIYQITKMRKDFVT